MVCVPRTIAFMPLAYNEEHPQKQPINCFTTYKFMVVAMSEPCEGYHPPYYMVSSFIRASEEILFSASDL